MALPAMPPPRSLPALLAAGVVAAAGLAEAQTPPGCALLPAQVADRVSEVRAAGADCGSRGRFAEAGPLHWHPTLEAMALRHAQWLVSVGELRHTGAAGEVVGERALQAGYRYFRVGENLAHGQRSLDSALRAWTASDPHCATLFHPTYTDMALACVPARDGRPLWVLVLGRPAAGPMQSPR